MSGKSDIPVTFTPWRVLVLLLAGPVAAIATGVLIWLSPNGDQLLGGSVDSNGRVVVTITHQPVHR